MKAALRRKGACPRLFEVEALRDGRLRGVELERFQAHIVGCPSCAHEDRALEALAEALRSSSPSAGADELRVRRERTRLLAAFDASLVPAPRAHRARLWLPAAVVVALLTLAAVFTFVLWPLRPHPVSRAKSAEPSPDPVLVRADSSAQWSRRSAKQVDEIVLASGALFIRVDHAASARRLRVVLPDGELEDIGTTFSVSVEGGHTTRVTVQDGSVVLRLHGKPAIALGAGDAWSPPAAPLPAAPRPDSTRVVPRGASRPSSSAPGAEAPAVDAAQDFRAAMSAFDSGDNAHAARLFAAFVADHGRDARAEDAAYLRILALQRAGNAAPLQQAARDYLARYPRGFRHAEVEALAASP